MIEANFLLVLWHEQCTVFKDNLLIIREKMTRRALHDLRVAVKKLRSVIQFSGTFTDKPVTGFGSIQQFFRITGKRRDVDISLALLRKTAAEEKVLVPSFQKQLKTMLIITGTPIREHAEYPYENELDDITTELEKVITGYSAEKINKITEDLSSDLIREIISLQKDFTKNAHEIRKKLKQLFYWLQQCPVNPFFDKKQMRTLEKALKALGNWHDYYVVTQKLRSFRKEYIVKETEEYEEAVKLGAIFKLLQEQWLADAADKMKSLMMPE